MAVNILLKRSSTASKRPVGASMAFGELNLNYDASTGGLYYKNSAGGVVKVGPCQVSASAPNSSPAGSSGNSAGEFWFDTSTQTLKLYDGTTWVEAGGMVQGITGTSPITVNNADPLNPVIGINAASTTASGAVQLNDTTSSSSTTEALTANQGRILQTQIDALAVSSNLTFAGTIDASTGDMLTVSTEGSAKGFVIGDPLPSPAAGNSEFFVIVTVPGTMTPPGGVATECHQGDWFLSDGSAWNFLDVGYNAPYATTAVPGVVQLATNAEVQAGVNTDHAVTPSGLQSKVSDSTSTISSTTLASSTAVKTAKDAADAAQADADQALLDAAAAQATADAALPKAGGTMTGNVTFSDAGEGVIFSDASKIAAITNSTTSTSSTTAASATAVKSAKDAADAAQLDAIQALSDAAAAQSDATQALADAAAAQATADAAVPDSAYTAAGDLLVGTGSGTYSALASGPADYILASDGAGGLSWVQQSQGDVTGVTGTAPITVDNTDPQNPVVGVNAASTSAAGVVQLNDTVTSTSTTQAATANAVKTAYDAAGGAQSDATQALADAAAAQATADAALPKAGGTMTGNISFNPGQVFPGVVTSVTSAGGSAISVDNTDPTQPVLSVASASTTAPGVVQLNDTTTSTSTTEALTAAQGKNLQDQIDALVISSNITLAGTYDASTGLVDSVTTAGAAAGFTVGSALPSPSAGNADYFVIVDVQGSDGPSGTPPYHIGDWFLSDGTAWQFLNVGFQAPYATTTTEGVVQLATNAEVQAGSNTDHAVVPSALQSKMSDSTSTTSSTTIASSTAVKSAYDLANAAMPKSGGNFTGNVTFDPGTTLTLSIADLVSNGSVQVDNLFSLGASSVATIQGIFGFDSGSSLEVNAGASTSFSVNLNLFGAGTSVVFSDSSRVEAISNSTSLTSSVTAASSTAVKSAYDLANAALPKAGGTMTGDLTFSGAGNGIVFQDASSVEAISNSVSTVSSITAASSTAVKTAYDAALAAQAASPMASATVLFVNVTTGNNTTAARGTAKPYATITAAVAAASEGDTIFVAPGTYVESVTLNKGVNLVGTFVDQAISSGPKISGTFTVSISGVTTRNWAVSNFQFQASSAGNNSVVVSNNSFGSGGIGSFTNCFFGQFSSGSLTEQAFATSGTWTRSLYVRNCTFDGNFTHNAGTVGGASGYIVLDNVLGIGATDKYYKVMTGTCEFRNPSNALAPVLQTGGVFIADNVLSWSSNSAATTTIFGGTGFAYKGTSGGLGQAYVYLVGGGNTVVEGTTWGKLSVGSNVIYAFNQVSFDTSLATLSGTPLYAVAPNANGVTTTMSRPQWSYLMTSSSVAAANQLGVVLDSTNGNVYTVSSFDAGTF